MRTALLRAASVVLLVAAVVFAAFAFTRFGGESPPQPGSPAFRDYGEKRMEQARLTIVLGLAASVSLFGAFALHSLASKRPEPPGP